MANPTRRKHRPTTRQRHKHRQIINPPHPPAAVAAAIPELGPAAAAAIPDDVFFSHIFVNLPVRSLTRFRAVCRSWHAAVDDPVLLPPPNAYPASGGRSRQTSGGGGATTHHRRD
uniref:F-box domain-containing protein n=1 Tax=Oryza barthii TaxID=65489 RepID=A0A0D3FV26_9ORYZ